MAENKKGFILYADQKELFDQLPNDKAGELIKHIFKYVNDENPHTNDLIINLAFTPIKQQLKRDLKKFEAAKKQRSEAGKRSAEVRAEQRNATPVETVERTSTKSTVTVNDTVNDNVKVTDNVKVKDIKIKKKPKGISNLNLIDFPKMKSEIFELWQFWVAYKWDEHKQEYKTQQSELIALRKFWTEYKGDFEKMKAAVENSIANLYKGIFAPKKQMQLNGKPKRDF